MLHDTFLQERRFWHQDSLIRFVAWFDNSEQEEKMVLRKEGRKEVGLDKERDKVVT